MRKPHLILSSVQRSKAVFLMSGVKELTEMLKDREEKRCSQYFLLKLFYLTCKIERLEIPLQCHLRQIAHFLKAWANAITNGLKDHLSPAAMFCEQSILVAGSGEHLITLGQWLEYYSGKQKASVQTSNKAKERTQPLSSTSWMSLASRILGMGLLLHPWHDSWRLATGKNGGLESLLLGYLRTFILSGVCFVDLMFKRTIPTVFSSGAKAAHLYNCSQPD